MLPEIQKFQDVDLPSSFVPICAAGFEDRAGAIFEEVDEDDINNISQGIVVEYLPFIPENDVERIERGFREWNIPDENHIWITYDRQNPSDFEIDFRNALRDLQSNNILLDVSGMSNLLIFLLIALLSEESFNIFIFYAEAREYKPTLQEFEKRKGSTDAPDETPAFLTSGIYDIMTTPALSSTAMGAEPIITITFPTFNHQEMMALANELSPHVLISLICVPHLSEDYWRKDAIEWLNQETKTRLRVEQKEVSTFQYKETYNTLWELYLEYSDAYKLVLAPTGSKLQTVAAALFRRVNSDVQVVYPITKEFRGEYSQGWKDTWGIELGNVDHLLEGELPHGDTKVDNLKMLIDRARKDE